MSKPALKNLIILEGGIAAGKTSLLRKLEKQYGLYAIEEPATNNPHLAKFYSDPHKYAFEFQMWFLELRIGHYQQATRFAQEHPEKIVILDRSVYSDYVFALNCHQDGFISKEQFSEYMVRYNEAVQSLPPPGAMIYLDVDPEICLYRIKNIRMRECELGIPLEYLQGLYKCYKILIENMRSEGVKTITVDWSKFGSVEDIYEKCRVVSRAIEI